ncbi:tyrosine-type recombinase/integrase [Veillonella agrestimuris]|uniref:tyrosine-type recombinase/integrase n=1 Tax=Veillonella agrestimuris TaxID=2941340 RepID=UPI00204137EE|nr:site-specific integrase [Veillonella agrestimuris]
MWIEEIINSKGTRYKYCERFTLPNGKTKRISITLNSNSRYAQKQATIELQKKQEKVLETLGINKVTTFYDVAMMWLDYTEPTIKLSTHVNHTLHVKKIFKYIDTSTLLTDITPLMVEEILQQIYYIENLSYSYMRSIFVTIKAIYKHAKRKGFVPVMIDFDDVEIKKKPFSHSDIAKRQNKFLDADELKDVLHQLTKVDTRIGLLFEFVSITGLRIGELLALRYCDYDKEKATVSINGTIQYQYANSSEIKRGTPKNIYSVREITLCNRAVQILNSIITENKRRALWFTGYEDKGYLFTTTRGNPYDLPFLNRMLKKVHIDGKNLTTHIFRHTHISILAELGVPLKAIMQRVGHNDPNTTLSIYTHVTQNMHDDVIVKLNARKA